VRINSAAAKQIFNDIWVSLRRLYLRPYCPATWLMKPMLSNSLRIEWSTKRSGFIKLMSAAEAGPRVTIRIHRKMKMVVGFIKLPC
jgi:hypothetical protein